uniref:Cytoglobin-1-like isoform X2 n=1 Tax=Geotrypetes seraphini TaxID=260995 RepID=A0A6P8S4L6_GEOSA|nr:cytoglobin-1-like isoform X2 [Geotrypetes seraphini]
MKGEVPKKARPGGYRRKSAPPLSKPQPLSPCNSPKLKSSLFKNPGEFSSKTLPELFETHPECKDAFFLFREIDDLQELKMSKQLQAHGLRVMSFIEKSVARLTQEDKLEQLATDLGRSHFKYSAPPKYYQYVGVQFIDAVKPFLKERWTLEVEEAWEGLFAHITTLMNKGYQEAERGSDMKKSANPEKADTFSIGSIQNSV